MTGPADPLPLLAELLDAMDAGRVPHDDVRQWLADGIRGVVDGCALDAGLGLVKRGQRPIRARLVQRRVDQYLHLAIEAAPAVDPDASWWDRCCLTAPLLRGYLASTWRHDRHLAEPPSSRAPWQIWVWYAANLNPSLPCGARGLWDALQRVRAMSLQPSHGSLVAHLMSHPCPHPFNASRSSDPSAPAE